MWMKFERLTQHIDLVRNPRDDDAGVKIDPLVDGYLQRIKSLNERGCLLLASGTYGVFWNDSRPAADSCIN